MEITKTKVKQVPRLDAVRVITRVLSQQQPLDEALADLGRSFAPEEFAWLQEVCSGTLRWRGILDEILDSVALKKKPSGWLRKILMIATYQIVVQDRAPIPRVVHETVSWVRQKEGEAPAKFANACLRKISDHQKEWNLQSPAHLRASLPEWLWKRLVQEKGEAWALNYAEASLDRPKLWLRVRHNHEAESLEKSFGLRPGPVSGAWEMTQGGRIPAVPGFSEGKFIVQDISSQLLISEVSQWIYKNQNSENIFRVLDLCAAPGGKSVGLAWNGFQVTATEKNAKRLPLLSETVARAAPEVQTLSWDELRLELGPDQTSSPTWPFSLVWIDAPCSGSGILRRHPEVRWLRKEKELEALQKTQSELLKMAWERMSPESYLVYSVCSVLEEEGPGSIARSGVLKSGTELKRWALSPQETPHGDGFWGILIKKNA